MYDCVFIKALGNHEFDRGPETLAEFLKNVSFPVISSNMDASGAPVMKGLTRKSVVLEVGGEKVGIVGYTTTETAIISQPGELCLFNYIFIYIFGKEIYLQNVICPKLYILDRSSR